MTLADDDDNMMDIDSSSVESLLLVDETNIWSHSFFSKVRRSYLFNL